MPHVTFIHGIANKPPKDKLLWLWEQSLIDGGLDLSSEGVTTSLVYWADVMYAAPNALEDGFESVNEGLGTEEADEDQAWIDGLSDQEKAFVARMQDKFGVDAKSPEGDDFTPEAPAEDVDDLRFEAIPLPWFIKRRVMKCVLRDVHHYMFNATHAPRPGETYQVQDYIRKLFVDQLVEDSAANDGGPHVVVAHSMGTVISYDCLKNVPDCPGISAYMTLGCPLGISEVYDNFHPAYDKDTAFPDPGKLAGNWVNVYDRLDPVAFDSKIANDYQKNGRKVIIDQKVRNSGAWRHSSSKYFKQQALCNHLRTLLEL